jgi:hypothetical protein
MKKIIVMSLLMSSLSFAAYTKEDRVADMVAMEASMAKIQKGFLYNNNEMIQSGSAELRDKVLTIQPPRVGDKSISRDQTYAFMFARKQQRKIDSHAAKMADRFGSGDKYQAMQHFTKILKQCTACHTKLRSW